MQCNEIIVLECAIGMGALFRVCCSTWLAMQNTGDLCAVSIVDIYLTSDPGKQGTVES